jgi:hypothetical protein
MRQALRDYRAMLWELEKHEGWRAWRWPAAAVGLFVAIWAIPLAGAITGAYLARGGDGFGWIALSATAALVFVGLGSYWSKGQPWRKLIERRVAAYWQESDALDYAGALIDVEDFGPAMHALCRAGLNAHGRSAAPVPGAALTRSLLSVFRPSISVRTGQESVSDATRRVLQEAGIEAQVDGHQGGRPIAKTIATYETVPAGPSTPPTRGTAA